MQAVILAGGRGTRLGKISSIKPKPMVEIGGKPIIWHIMKLYNHYDVKEFIICVVISATKSKIILQIIY